MNPKKTQQSGFDYMRNPFHTKWNTRSQARELRLARELYTTCLTHPGFPPLEETPLAVQDDNCRRPKYSSTDYRFVLPLPPKQPGPLFVPAKGAMQLVQRYLTQRHQRGWRKGHLNDPTQLFCTLCLQILRRLANAPCDQDTQTQLTQLKTWLTRFSTADQGQAVFRNEPLKGDKGMTVLLRGLVKSVGQMSAGVKKTLALQTSHSPMPTGFTTKR